MLGPSLTCAPVNNPSSMRGRWWSPLATCRGGDWSDPVGSAVLRGPRMWCARPRRSRSPSNPLRVSRATWLDGGLLSNFPGGVVPSLRRPGRWPTFGIRLTAQAGAPPPTRNCLVRSRWCLPRWKHSSAIRTPPTSTTLRAAHHMCAVIGSTAGLRPPRNCRRPSSHDRGVQAAQHFLETWQLHDYLIACRGAASPSPPV